MKKYLIGLLSALLLAASIFGGLSKGPSGRRGPRPGGRADRALWI